MARPKSKHFGGINLTNIGEAVKAAPNKVKDSEQYGKELQVEAAYWEDGSISLYIWDGQKEHKIGNLRLSKY